MDPLPAEPLDSLDLMTHVRPLDKLYLFKQVVIAKCCPVECRTGGLRIFYLSLRKPMSQTTAAKFYTERNPERNRQHSRLCSYHSIAAEFTQFLQAALFASQKRMLLYGDSLAVTSTLSRQAQAKNDNLREEIVLFSSYVSVRALTYQAAINYLNRVAALGVLMAQ